MQRERRNLAARSARNTLGELLAVHPRHLSGLDALTASAIANSIRAGYGPPRLGPRPSRVLAAVAKTVLGPRYPRVRRLLHGSYLYRERWRVAAVAEFGLIMLIVGSLLGGYVVTVMAPSTRTGASRTTLTPAATGAPAPTHRPSPAAAELSGPLAVGVQALAAKTGLAYSAEPCAAGQRCLTRAQLQSGDQAGYVSATALGYDSGDTCYAYLHESGGAWSSDLQVCGSGSAFGPAAGASLPVRAPGTCARLHRSPGLNTAVVACLPDGTIVNLTSPPAYQDGHYWWPVEAGSRSGVIAMEALPVPG